MKILFLARRFNPDIGGVEKHVLEIGKRLVEKNHDVTVITQSQGEVNEIYGIKIVRMKVEGKISIWKWVLRNRKIFSQADIIHAHDVYFWYFPMKLLYPDKKSFITFHGYETFPIEKRAIFVRKISEKLSNGNIIVGEFIRKWYGTNPNYIIYGGVDHPKKLFSPSFKKSALFYGRLDDQTGILEYVRTIQLLKNKYSDFKFKIIGDGKYKNLLNQYDLNSFKNNPEKEFKNYYFAFTSRYLSILEAFSYKRLVFAFYDNPVKEDYLKMSPFSEYIIIEKDPKKMAGKIEYFINNPEEVSKITEDAYEWSKKNSWEKIVVTYLKLWNL